MHLNLIQVEEENALDKLLQMRKIEEEKFNQIVLSKKKEENDRLEIITKLREEEKVARERKQYEEKRANDLNELVNSEEVSV